MSTNEQAKALIDAANRIAIAGHVNPDGDSYASVLGLGLALQEAGKEVDMLAEENNAHFSYLPAFSLLRAPDPDKSYDLFIRVDLGDTPRMGTAKIAFDHSKHSLNFDHHLTNDGLCDCAILDPKASSTCEIIARFLLETDMAFSADAATALYTGLITDSNRYLYDTSTARTLRIGADLMDRGADAQRVYFYEYQNENPHMVAFRGIVTEQVKQLHGGKVIVANITQEMLHHYGIAMPQAEGVVDDLRSLAGVEVAAILKEQDADTQKISFRSKAYFDVAAVAQKLGGGGHKKAAGATLHGSNADCWAQFLHLMEALEIE